MIRMCSTIFAIAIAAAVPAAEPPRVVRERIEWLDVWIPGNDTSTLPRVLLVGDSITRAYYKTVDEKLAGKAVVCRLATSKSVGDPALLSEVQMVLSQTRFDVIHLNNGMHGWGYTEAEYAAALPDLLAIVRKGAPTAKLIWATTTPVRMADHLDQADPKTDRVIIRNAAVAKLASREGIPVNDLFAAVDNKPDLFSRDGVHLNPKGTAALAERVVTAVQAAIAGK